MELFIGNLEIVRERQFNLLSKLHHRSCPIAYRRNVRAAVWRIWRRGQDWRARRIAIFRTVGKRAVLPIEDKVFQHLRRDLALAEARKGGVGVTDGCIVDLRSPGPKNVLRSGNVAVGGAIDNAVGKADWGLWKCESA